MVLSHLLPNRLIELQSCRAAKSCDRHRQLSQVLIDSMRAHRKKKHSSFLLSRYTLFDCRHCTQMMVIRKIVFVFSYDGTLCHAYNHSNYRIRLNCFGEYKLYTHRFDGTFEMFVKETINEKFVQILFNNCNLFRTIPVNINQFQANFLKYVKLWFMQLNWPETINYVAYFDRTFDRNFVRIIIVQRKVQWVSR